MFRMTLSSGKRLMLDLNGTTVPRQHAHRIRKYRHFQVQNNARAVSVLENYVEVGGNLYYVEFKVPATDSLQLSTSNCKISNNKYPQ